VVLSDQEVRAALVLELLASDTPPWLALFVSLYDHG